MNSTQLKATIKHIIDSIADYNLSYNDVASVLQLHPNTIRNYEKDKWQSARVDTVIKMLKYLEKLEKFNG